MCKSIEINQNGKRLFSCSYKYTKWLLWLIFPSHQELGSTPFPSQHSYVLQGTRNKIHLSFKLSAFFPVNLPLVKFLNISWFLQLLPFTIGVVSGVFILLYKLEVLQNSWGMSVWILGVVMALGKEEWEMALDGGRTHQQVGFIYMSLQLPCELGPAWAESGHSSGTAASKYICDLLWGKSSVFPRGK